MNLVKLIHDFPFLEGIEQQVGERLAQATQEMAAARGEVLCRFGEKAEYLFLIKSGWVKLCRQTADGEEAILNVVGAGYVIGEGAVLGGGELSYTAQAVDACTFCRIPAAALGDALAASHQLSLNFLKILSRHGQRQEDEIEHLTMQKAPQRIGCFLLEMSGRQAEGRAEYDLPFDKSLLAAKLGMKPETFSRALAQLREHGVQVTQRRVVIDDIAALSDYTCAACSGTYPCDDKK